MSADTDDLRIGKGIAYFLADGDGEELERDLGFVPTFALSKDITEKDYNSAREGVTTVAITFITKVKNTVKFRMDSIVPENLALYGLGTAHLETDGTYVISELTKTAIKGRLRIAGSNDQGRKIDWRAIVSMRPDGELNLITDGDDITGINMVATVTKDDTLGYGKWTVHPLT